MVEASHSLVIQITEEEIKEKACEIQKQVIGHDAGMADYIVKPEELHITLAMLQIEDAEGIEMVKKIITDNADDLKGAIIRIGGISTFSQDHVLYAKVVTLPSGTLDRLSSVIKKRVSQCSQKVQLIRKQQQEEYVHHMSLFHIPLKEAKTIPPDSYQKLSRLGAQHLNNIQLCVVDDKRRPDGFYNTLLDVKIENWLLYHLKDINLKLWQQE